MQSSKGRTGPLGGVTVITLEHAIAAPFCTRQLADLGADPRFDARMDAVPALGEHSEAILRGLGRSDADIAALRTQGVI